MAIDFPCLQKDISVWFPSNNNRTSEVVRKLEKSLTISEQDSKHESIIVQSKNKNVINWLDNKETLGDRSSDSNNFNIMSPVLKETPNSIWLAGRTQTTEVIKEKRVADLTTSVWLATSSSEPFTCVTRSTNNAAAIQWPTILFQDSPNVWLSQQQVERNDIDQWLAKKNAKCNQNSSMTESVFDNWIKCQGSSVVWSAQDDVDSTTGSDQTLDMIHNKWLKSGSNNDQDELAPMNEWNDLGASSSQIIPGTSVANLKEEEDHIESDAKSYVEKWLCLAVNEDSEMNINVNDDESSIAILSFGDEDQTDSDYDMVDEQEGEGSARKLWLF